MRDTYWDEGLRGWIVGMARTNHWRMAAWYGLDDLIQDGALCYCKCREAYPDDKLTAYSAKFGVVSTPALKRKHFMLLFQTSYLNHITTLASKYAMGRELATPDTVSPEDHSDSLEKLMPSQPEEASVIFALKNAPAEIRDAIEKLLKDGADSGEYVRTQLYREGNRIKRTSRTSRARRETTAEYFERVLGVADLPDKIRVYLFS